MTFPRSALSLFALACLLALSPISSHASGLPPPGLEYPVVWWAQNHVKEALRLYRTTSWQSLGEACRSGILSRKTGTRALGAFIRDHRRRTFCRRFPGPTHHLLREAPYFMVRPPGAQK
jgi:hypothetical protein